MTGHADDLVAHAIAAAKGAYAPYSNFHVGAALLLDDGSVVTGANFENASYGLSLCAETVAMAKVANDGKLANVIAVAVAGGAKGFVGQVLVTPCGRCRQILNESAQLGGRDLDIYCATSDGHQSFTLSALLPYGFGPADLGITAKDMTA